VWLAGAVVRRSAPRTLRGRPSTLKGRCAIAARRPAAALDRGDLCGPCQAKDTGRPGGLPAGRAALSIYSPTPSPGSGPYKDHQAVTDGTWQREE
jgi:hypothetical protein